MRPRGVPVGRAASVLLALALAGPLWRCNLGDDPELDERRDAAGGGPGERDASSRGDAVADGDGPLDSRADHAADAPTCDAAIASDPGNCGSCGTVCGWNVCAAGACDDPIALAASGSHTCALRRSGRVACWGSNNRGALGDGSSEERSVTPRAVVSLGDAVQIAAGGQTSCARRVTGGVVCWGPRLGISADLFDASPVAVSGIGDAAEVGVGHMHACIRRTSGQVVCWGNNQNGRLGNDSTTNSATPQPVYQLTDAAQIGVGADHTCARRTSGQVVCWGSNAYGALGNPSVTESPVPVAVSGLSDAVEIAVGAGHSCARRASGQAVCWGSNSLGQLGNDSTAPTSATPVAVAGLSDAVELAAGVQFSCAVRGAARVVVCWGGGGLGTLGNDQTEDSRVPVTVTGVRGVIDLDLGSVHACAARGTGHVACWGNNGSLQLGFMTLPYSQSATPFDVTPPTP